MFKKSLPLFVITLLAITLTACSVKQSTPFCAVSDGLKGCAVKHATSYPPFTAKTIAKSTKTVEYKQKAHTFYALLDTHSSTNPIYDKANVFESKFTVQKQILNRVNKTIPQKLQLDSGLRTFGNGKCVDRKGSTLLQSVMPHARYTYQRNIDKATCASGRSFASSPLSLALSRASSDLNEVQGDIALLIVSDGYDISDRAFSAVNKLKNKFSDRLCVYSIWVGNKEEKMGQRFLQKLSNAAGCGESVAFYDILDSKPMGLFVENMLFEKTSISPLTIESSPLDTDNDGILDDDDLCPMNTPEGAPINQYGCWEIMDLEFDYNKADIRDGHLDSLDSSIEILRNIPEINIQIEGHTDSYGSEEYNQELSIRRADTVREYLIQNGIDAERLTAIGMGESSPISTNKTDEGRQLNRRVMFTIL